MASNPPGVVHVLWQIEKPNLNLFDCIALCLQMLSRVLLAMWLLYGASQQMTLRCSAVQVRAAIGFIITIMKTQSQWRDCDSLAGCGRDLCIKILKFNLKFPRLVWCVSVYSFKLVSEHMVYSACICIWCFHWKNYIYMQKSLDLKWNLWEGKSCTCVCTYVCWREVKSKFNGKSHHYTNDLC